MKTCSIPAFLAPSMTTRFETPWLQRADPVDYPLHTQHNLNICSRASTTNIPTIAKQPLCNMIGAWLGHVVVMEPAATNKLLETRYNTECYQSLLQSIAKWISSNQNRLLAVSFP